MAKLGSAAAVESYWNQAAPHLQARYCHASLGTKIRIERIGNFKHYAKIIRASGAGLDSVRADTRNDLGDADLMTYMAYQDTTGLRSWTNGIAWLGRVCHPHPLAKEQKASINHWQSSAVAFGSVN